MSYSKKSGSYVKINVKKGLLVMKPTRRIEDLIGDYANSISVEKADELSIEAQKEAEDYE